MKRDYTNYMFNALRNMALPALALMLGAAEADAQCVIATSTTVNATTINPATCSGVITVNGTLEVTSDVDWTGDGALVVDISGTGALMSFPGVQNTLYLAAGSSLLLGNGGLLDVSTPCSNTDKIYIGVAFPAPAGSQAYASCAGGGNSDYIFAELNAYANSVSASATATPATVCIGEPFNLSVSGSVDPSMTPMSVTWTGTGPGGYTYSNTSNASSIDFSFNPNATGNTYGVAGVYTFTARVSDNLGHYRESTVTVTVNNSGVGGCKFIWTGTQSTVWNNANNWAGGSVPGSANDVRIPTAPTGGNMPTVNIASASANSLEVQPGATLTISSGNALAVGSGTLNNNGTVTVQNNASLVQTAGSTLTGSGTFNVTRVGSSVYDFWSSPVTAAPTSLLGGTVYQYNPIDGTSSTGDDAHDPAWGSPSGANMAVGRGYAAYGAGTRTFTGQVNNGNIAVPVEYHDHNISGMPFNLIGNPYPSGIGATDFINANSGILADGTLYLWDDPGTISYTGGDYATRNLSGGTAGGGGNAPGPVIGSHQAFKVKVNANGSVNFQNSLRTAANTAMFFRQAEDHRIWLSAVSSENRYNQTLIAFLSEATDDEDWGYDGPKLNATGSWSFYSVLDGEPFAIQAYGEMATSRIVPLGLHTQESAMATIALDSTQGSHLGDVILEDRFYGTFHDLRSGAYSFRAAQGEHVGRLFLHLGYSDITGVTTLGDAGLQGYIADNRLFIRSQSPLSGSVELIDMSGRVVFRTQLNPQDAQINEGFDVSALVSGIYAIRLHDAAGVRSVKAVKQ
jgi:hypothetical protein